jgi:hypothetical protein
MIVSAILFALLLGAFIFVVLPRGTVWQRASATLIFAVLIGIVYGGSIELLSRPKPLRLEWRDAATAKVLGANLREGEAIYVWLQVDGSPEPRAYALPWSMKLAQQLQDAMQSGQASGGGVEMRQPFGAGSGDDKAPKFYAPPQQALPDKNYGSDRAILYRPAGDRH